MDGRRFVTVAISPDHGVFDPADVLLAGPMAAGIGAPRHVSLHGLWVDWPDASEPEVEPWSRIVWQPRYRVALTAQAVDGYVAGAQLSGDDACLWNAAADDRRRLLVAASMSRHSMVAAAAEQVCGAWLHAAAPTRRPSVVGLSVATLRGDRVEAVNHVLVHGEDLVADEARRNALERIFDAAFTSGDPTPTDEPDVPERALAAATWKAAVSTAPDCIIASGPRGTVCGGASALEPEARGGLAWLIDLTANAAAHPQGELRLARATDDFANAALVAWETEDGRHWTLRHSDRAGTPGAAVSVDGALLGREIARRAALWLLSSDGPAGSTSAAATAGGGRLVIGDL